jgi:hypothetical protein
MSDDTTSAVTRTGSEVESVCLLANRYLLGWQVEALQRLVAETTVDVALVVVNEADAVDDPGFSRGASSLGAAAYENPRSVGLADLVLFSQLLRTEGAWAFVLAEKKFGWMLGGDEPELMKRHAVGDVDVLSDTTVRRCSPVPVDGDWCDLPDDVVDQVVAETDVAVRFGFSLLTGRIISEPTHGVLSFHPADVTRYRGLGPVQPFLADAPTAGVTLQQLTEDLDGGNVVAIEHVDVSDRPTLEEIRRRLNVRQTGMLADGVRRLNDPDFEPTPPDSLGTYTSVRNRRSPVFSGRVLAKNLRRRLEHRFRSTSDSRPSRPTEVR